MRYSNTKLKGLKTPKEIVIKKLSEYINLFSKGDFNSCLFRGEPTNYYSITSSALRRYSNSFLNSRKEFPFIDMKNEFKREIWHKINRDERENFLAFSQHYGLPTNLVDFTKSPLVSLYFACQPYHGANDNFDSTRGFVNVIENKLIDITDILTKTGDINLLDEFIDDEFIFVELYSKFVEYESKYPFDFYKYFKQLNEDMHYYFYTDFNKLPIASRFPSYSDGDYKEKIWDRYDRFETEENKKLINCVQNKYEDFSIEILIYTLYLRTFLKQVVEYTEPVWWINCIPNFVYTPILSFERGINQQGLFIYQSFLSFTECVYETPVCSIQRIWSDTIIVVENKEKILEELDFIGINQKYIYSDFDNIARYIKNKYL